MSEPDKPEGSIAHSSSGKDGRRSNLLFFKPRTAVLNEQPEPSDGELASEGTTAKKPGEATLKPSPDAKAPWA